VKIAVIRAEYGRVVESFVFEGELEDIVKDVARHAMEEWNPGSSDFFVIKEVHALTVTGSPESEVIEELERRGMVAREEGSLKVLATIYYITFDTELGEDENYIDRKMYVIAPLISPDFKDELEYHAASMTGGRGGGPPGVKLEGG
jgi:hypothetical protein